MIHRMWLDIFNIMYNGMHCQNMSNVWFTKQFQEKLNNFTNKHVNAYGTCAYLGIGQIRRHIGDANLAGNN